MATAKAELATKIQENEEIKAQISVMSEFNETVYRIASEFFSKIPEELKEENKGQ